MAGAKRTAVLAGICDAPAVKPERASRKQIIRFVFGSNLLLVIALWAGIYAYLGHARHLAYAAAEQTAANYSHVLEEHLLNTVRAIDQTATFVKFQSEHMATQPDLAAYAGQGVFLSKFFNLIGIIDAEGWLVASDRPLPRSNLADREHFKAHVAADNGQLFISKPVLGRSSGKWALQFTRRINKADGSFGGVVVASLDAAYFNEFYRAISLGEDGVMAIIGDDGVVRARNNGSSTEIGQNVSESAGFKAMVRSGTGSAVYKSTVDGVTRVVHFRKLPDYPLSVTVGLSEAAILHAYSYERNLAYGFGALITLMIIVSGALLSAHVRATRRFESALQQSEQQAQAANTAKSLFLANMSHELRTPMHAILSFGRLGLEKSARGEVVAAKMHDYFDYVVQSGERLLVLLNDLLDLSKLEAGKMVLDLRPHDAATIVNGAVAELDILAGAKSIRLDAAALKPGVAVECDGAKIHQVLTNLLSNAIKFSPSDSVVSVAMAEITLPALRDGEAALQALSISVRDRGIAIPPDELESVFDSFVQSSKTVDGSGGTGLGLSICRRIVEVHGGRISAANNGDCGASFTVILPLKQAAESGYTGAET
jgi:signal transduction histidine kinase